MDADKSLYENSWNSRDQANLRIMMRIMAT